MPRVRANKTCAQAQSDEVGNVMWVMPAQFTESFDWNSHADKREVAQRLTDILHDCGNVLIHSLFLDGDEIDEAHRDIAVALLAIDKQIADKIAARTA